MFGFKKDKTEAKIEVKTEEKATWFKRLSSGLNKSSSKFNDGLKNIFVNKKLDAETLEELEDLLISSDIGVKTSSIIIEELSKNKFGKEISLDEIKLELAQILETIIAPVTKPLEITDNKPHVIFVCGVNGAGKTTTIGKLCSNYKKEGKKVVIAACDTFRAAAVEQLEVWSKRAKCEIIMGEENSDPASVAYKAFEYAKNNNSDILIIDTAGRLHNKKNLMQQLKKINNVIKKLDADAPHDSVIVLDATTGQNANNQVRIFSEAVDISGIIVTKLDGSAKGGVVISLANEFDAKIHAIGVGEAIEDLKPFDAKMFAKSLVGLY